MTSILHLIYYIFNGLIVVGTLALVTLGMILASVVMLVVLSGLHYLVCKLFGE